VKAMKLMAAAGVFVVFAAGAPGCADAGYQLRGRVVQGETSFVSVVDADDPRLEGMPVPNASLHLQMDPGNIKRETIARAVSGADGSFAIDVDRFGAGWVEYDVGLFVRKSGFDPAMAPFRLPPESRRVLVVLSPGRDHDLGEEARSIDQLQEDAERLMR